MWFILVIVVLIICIFYRMLKFWIIDPWLIHRDLWAQGIPGRHIPLIGEIFNIRKCIIAGDPFAHQVVLEKQFGNYYHVSFGPVARLDTSDPALINGVLKTNARAYHKAYVMRLTLGVLLGNNNLLMAEDEIHAQHRRLIEPVFQHQNLNSMISLMVDITSNLTGKWSSMTTVAADQNKPLVFDIHEEMAKLTLDIVTSCVFGTEIMSDEKMHKIVYRTITESLELMEKRLFNMTAIIPIINRLPLSSKRRIDKCVSEGKQLIRQIVDNRKKGLTKSACKGPDLLDLLLAASGEDKASKFTNEEVYEEALTFVAAGHETTSTLMTWTLYNLTNNPDVYRRLEAEVDSVLNDDEEITPSTLSLLSYTEAVLKEALRIHQPVPAIVRTAVKDNTLVASDGKQIHIKKGTGIFLNFYMLHHSEKYWHEPFKFDPSRFDGNQSEKLIFPFSAGPRSCVGKNFAMLEAKIMLALIIRKFRFELEPAQNLTPEIVVTMRPKYGMRMRIYPR
ncbi:unnamed protein product [Rotaria magnacalcarata]|uniref:Cytochrome P450 n=2 Tax=Rotaria magnacalcarata TaxID=392030 RepID=A0A816VRL9_9BILA|nr:unnamed protein product [Rotaria magnacalcarata]